MSWLNCLSFAAIAAILSLQPAFADPFKVLKDVGKAATAPITAPIEATKKIIKRDDPKEILKAPLESAGRDIERASKSFQNARDAITKIEKSTIRNVLGEEWEKAFDTLSAPQRVQFELATTSGRFLGQCVQGKPCSPDQMVALPLAAAMRDAYKIYLKNAQPFDDELTRILSKVVSPRAVRSARWVIGDTPDFTIPGFLNAGHELAGQAHAVVLGNVVIFSQDPDLSTPEGWEWLLHELRHVEQYMGYSLNWLEAIDGFAVDYIQNYNKFEKSAEETASKRFAKLEELCGNGC